jgi:hypothetical protein
MPTRADICRTLSESAFESVKTRLPAADVEFVHNLIFEHNEWGVGMETLVDTLLEDDIAISADQKKAIVEAMNALGKDRRQMELRVVD